MSKKITNIIEGFLLMAVVLWLGIVIDTSQCTPEPDPPSVSEEVVGPRA